MTSYLLLRNNKESGPFTLNELVSQGLKAYDLVWANGKSAAWRYPGEIDELKEYAPIVEEQPYDRFFKKPSEQKKEEPAATRISQRSLPVEDVPAPIIQKSSPVIEEIKPSYVAKKSVFVTLPGQKQQQAVTKEETPVKKYEQYQPRINERVYETEEPVPPAKTITITENPVTAEVKYSQPLDEIKEMYVKTLQDRKQKIAYKAFLLQSVKKIAVVLAIAGAGILIGFAIKSNSGKKTIIADRSAQQQQVTQPQSTETIVLNEEPAAITGEQPAEQTVEQARHETIAAQRKMTAPVLQQPVTEKVINETSTVATLPKKENTQLQHREVATDEPSPGVELNERTGERNRKVRNAEDETTLPVNEQPKAMMRSVGSLSKLVSVNTNEYQRVAFGGIRNLQLTVINDSKYILDNVVVELQYLKPSEEPLRTENISFRSISPGGSSTIRIPDTNRGIKVLYKITNILSIQAAKDLADL